MKDTITLKEYVKHCGSQAEAGISLGVRQLQIHYWLKGTFKPNAVNQRKLDNMGIVI